MKYIYSETLTNYSGEQKGEYKKIKAKLRKPDRMLVTKRYEPQAYTYQNKHGIVGKVINMYDYFQNTIDVPVKDLHVRLSDVFDTNKYKIKGVDNNQSDVYLDGTKVAEVNIAPLTVQLVGTITWLNIYGEPMSRDFYDRRGFKSSTQYFHLDGSLGHQIMFDYDGNIKLEVIPMTVDGQDVTSFKLINYNDADYLFATESDMWKFFQSELENEVQ